MISNLRGSTRISRRCASNSAWQETRLILKAVTKACSTPHLQLKRGSSCGLHIVEDIVIAFHLSSPTKETSTSSKKTLPRPFKGAEKPASVDAEDNNDLVPLLVHILLPVIVNSFIVILYLTSENKRTPNIPRTSSYRLRYGSLSGTYFLLLCLTTSEVLGQICYM